MSTSRKAVPRSKRSKRSKDKKRTRFALPTIAERFLTALTHDQYIREKWAKLSADVWTENDDLACLIGVERGTVSRGMEQLQRLNWERLVALRQKILRRCGKRFLLGELDSEDPELMLSAATLFTLKAIMAQRFPVLEKQLQALKAEHA